MPFNTPVTVDQEAILLAGGYSGRDFLLMTPFVIALQCRPAADSSADVIKQISYTGVAYGAYTNVREDMTVMITTGTSMDDFKRPLWRGRITQLPTSSVLYINESSIALDTDYYITVLLTYEPQQRLRSGNLIDGWKTFEKVPPAIKGLSSSYVKEPVSGEAQFSFAPVGQAMEDGATINDATAWHWEFSSAVTYDTGDADTRAITVTVPAGHVWATVTCEDSNGVTGKFVFEIYVQDRYAGLYIFAGNEGVDITNTWDDGVNASVRYFDGVQDVLDRWRCTVVTFESWRDGDAEFPNVSFVGYLRQQDDETRGDASYGTLKSRNYTIAGFASLMGECKQSPLAVFDKNSPSAWDEMKYPNAARVIEHLRQRYAVGTLQCIDYGDLNDNAWYGGDRDVESPFLLDACQKAAEEIDAQLVFAADGQMCLRRNASLLTDTAERDALDTIMEIPSSRIKVIGYSHPHLSPLAQLLVGYRSYRTADKSSIGLRGTAPAVAFDEGGDFDEVPNRLLTANASTGDARTEAGNRTAALYAYRNDADEFTLELDDGFRWIQPSVHQWWNAIVAASEMTNNVGLTASDRLLLTSVTHRFNPERGTRSVRATFRRETVPGLAMILVEVIPDEVPTVMPPRPPLPAYQGAFSPSGTLNHTSQTPARKPPGGYAVVSMPYSPKQQSEAQQQSGSLECRVQNPPVNFRNPSDVLTGFSTTVGETYTLFIKGDAQIGDDIWSHTFDMSTGLNGWTIVLDNLSNPIGAVSSGSGITTTDCILEPANHQLRGLFIIYDVVIPSMTSISIVMDFTAGSYLPNSVFWLDSSPLNLVPSPPSNGTNVATAYVPGGTFAVGAQIGIQVNSSYQTAYSGAALLKRITVTGTGTNPFTLAPGGIVRGDAFYQRVMDGDEDGAAELYPAYRGLRINSMPVAVPPVYNENHEYIVLYTGDGNPIPLRFQDDDYSDNQNELLRIAICGPGAGT